MSLLFCFQELDEKGFNTIHQALVRHRDKDRYTVFSLGAIQNALGGTLPAELQNNLIFCNTAGLTYYRGVKG